MPAMRASPAGGNPFLDRLRAQIATIERRDSATAHAALPFGVDEIDVALPARGLSRGALHEIGGGGRDPFHAAAATLFTAGLAARLAADTAPVLWCVSRHDLFAPGLAAVGLHPDLLIHVEAGNDTGVLRAVEEGVRHVGLAAVIGEVRRLPLVASRRLQLAAEASGVTVLMLLRGDMPGEAEPDAAQADPSAALTRWQIEAAPGTGADAAAGMARARWRVRLLRARGAVPADWLVEACDAQGRLAVPAALVDRPAAVEPRAHAA